MSHPARCSVEGTHYTEDCQHREQLANAHPERTPMPPRDTTAKAHNANVSLYGRCADSPECGVRHLNPR